MYAQICVMPFSIVFLSGVVEPFHMQIFKGIPCAILMLETSFLGFSLRRPKFSCSTLLQSKMCLITLKVLLLTMKRTIMIMKVAHPDFQTNPQADLCNGSGFAFPDFLHQSPFLLV